MWSNTKLIILAAIFTVITGLGFLWFGLRSEQVTSPDPSMAGTSLVETPPAASSSSTELTTVSSTALTKSSPAVAGMVNEQIKVIEVVDGDTFKLETGQTVRMIGIDTPETKDPRRPVGCFGKEASNKLTSLIEGERVILQKDVSEVDKYQRLLRYVYLPLEDGSALFVNDYLVREGYAKVLTYPPDVSFNEQLRQAERYARENKLGLWGKCQ